MYFAGLGGKIPKTIIHMSSCHSDTAAAMRRELSATGWDGLYVSPLEGDVEGRELAKTGFTGTCTQL